MTSTILPSLDPGTAKTWLDQGRAVLIDVREADEHARERIAGARLAPLSRFDPLARGGEHERIAIFHCNSGKRTTLEAARLRSAGFAQAYQLDGGLQAWKRAGLPVTADRTAPLPIMRQVQIAAGSLVVLGVVLAVLISPWFMALSGLVGAGLVFAGITGFCGMASLLARMPWNHPAKGSSAPATGTR